MKLVDSEFREKAKQLSEHSAARRLFSQSAYCDGMRFQTVHLGVIEGLNAAD